MTVDVYAPTPNDTLTHEEVALYKLIMAYRAEHGLAAVQLSNALTITAGRHATDMRANIWDAHVTLPSGANLHSWSDAYYYSDHRDPEVMWFAPERLGTGFTGYGFEIAVSMTGVTSVSAALAAWKGSAGHNDVILNLNAWTDLDWTSIGVGIDRRSNGETVMYVWFSDTPDPEAARLLGTASGNTLAGTTLKDRIFAGDGADTVTGVAGRDVLKGEAGNDLLSAGKGQDTLEGGSGQDTLTGGLGADRFVFASADGDVITDFGAPDVVILRGAAFKALGAVVEAGELVFGTAALQSDDRLVYDSASGRLWFDADGSGVGAAQLLATLTGGPALTAGDFLIR